MKKKNVLRLLAFIMAASLTLTSAPADLLSSTETVYAAQLAAPAQLVAADLEVEACSIYVKADKTTSTVSGATLQFLLVAEGQGEIDPNTSTNWIDAISGTKTRLSTTANNKLVDTSAGTNTQILLANHNYKVYQRYVNTSDNSVSEASAVCTVTTKKKSLVNAKIDAIVVDPDTNIDANTGNMIFKNAEIKPTVNLITLAYDYDEDGSKDTITGQFLSNNRSNFEYSYTNNINAGTADDTVNAPTVTVTGIGDYEGSTSKSFTILPFDLTTNLSKVRVSINGVTSDLSNGPTVVYNGLQQDPDVKVEAQITPNSTSYTELTRGTDYVVKLATSSNDSSSTTDTLAASSDTTDVDGYEYLNSTIDAGKVVLDLAGQGNYSSNAQGRFEIKKAEPTAPAAPSVTVNGSNSITIDTSDEELKYSYQYLILTETQYKNLQLGNLKWGDENNTSLSSSTSGITDAYAKAGLIVSGLNTKLGATTTTMKRDNIEVTYDATKDETTAKIGDTTSATIYVAGTTTSSNDKLQLVSGQKYYVVRRIISDNNTTASGVSAATEITMGPEALSDVVIAGATIIKKGDTVLGYNTIDGSADVEFTAFNKTYDKTQQEEVGVVLYGYNKNTNAKVTLNGYSVKYYTSKARTAESDRTSAGTVYVYAVGDNQRYSGVYYLGYYKINQKEVNAIVNDGAKVYDSTTNVTGLTADVKSGCLSGDSVHVEGITGTMDYAAVATQHLKSVDTSAATITGEGSANYKINYYHADARITVSKATVSIKGNETVDAVFAQAIDLTSLYKAVNQDGVTVADINSNVSFQINNVKTTTGVDYTSKICIDNKKLYLKDYDSLKDVTDITITVSYGTNDKAGAGSNYSISDPAGKVVTVVLNKATPVVKFNNAKVSADTHTNADWTTPYVAFPSYVRPATIKKIVEDSTNEYGIYNESGNIVKKHDVDGSTTGVEVVGVEYKYYDENGNQLRTYPYKDGTYYVKAYVVLKDDGVSSKHIKDNVSATAANTDSAGHTISIVGGSLKLVIGSGTASNSASNSNSSSSSDGANKDQLTEASTAQGYKVVSGKVYTVADDILVKNDFYPVDLDGDGTTEQVYADANGVVVKGKVFQVGTKFYYAMVSGKVRMGKAGIYSIAGSGKVYAYADGHLLVNASKVIGGKRYVANASGKLVRSGFTTTAKGIKYYLKNYTAVTSKKFTTTKGNTYIATKSGAIAKGNKIVTFNGKKYYVRTAGTVLKSATVKVGKKVYAANKNGVLTLQK